MIVAIDEMRNMCVDVLLKLGYPKKDAGCIVDEYVYGEISGKKSHGFSSFVRFACVRPADEPFTVVSKTGSFAIIDGKGNLGQVVGSHAMALAIKNARRNGVYVVGMRNMQPYLMPGYYARMAASEGMVSVVIDNSASRVAPFGGIDPKLGANPIGIAIPTEAEPIVLDMATAERAMGEVRLAKKTGRPLPSGMAIDANGNATVNPDEVSALLPFGGYKGFGLCLAIEVIAGALIGAKMGSQIKGALDRGYLFIVMSPSVMSGDEDGGFGASVGQLVSDVKSSRPMPGHEKILIPGERASDCREISLRDGTVDIDESVFIEIRDFGRSIESDS